MTREIKFRGKRVDNGKWIYGCLIANPYSVKILPIGWEISLNLEAVDVIPESVGEFTGLKDKNRDDIYEGDILGYVYDGSIFNWLIGFSDGGFILQNIGVDGYLMDAHNLKQSSCLDRIVIGNIYENAELLKQS